MRSRLPCGIAQPSPLCEGAVSTMALIPICARTRSTVPDTRSPLGLQLERQLIRSNLRLLLIVITSYYSQGGPYRERLAGIARIHSLLLDSGMAGRGSSSRFSGAPIALEQPTRFAVSQQPVGKTVPQKPFAQGLHDPVTCSRFHPVEGSGISWLDLGDYATTLVSSHGPGCRVRCHTFVTVGTRSGMMSRD